MHTECTDCYLNLCSPAVKQCMVFPNYSTSDMLRSKRIPDRIYTFIKATTTVHTEKDTNQMPEIHLKLNKLKYARKCT